MTQKEINVDLFDEVQRLKKENRELKKEREETFIFSKEDDEQSVFNLLEVLRKAGIKNPKEWLVKKLVEDSL